jgi:hypothetical protein
VSRLWEFYPGICLVTEEKARKNLSQGNSGVRVSLDSSVGIVFGLRARRQGNRELTGECYKRVSPSPHPTGSAVSPSQPSVQRDIETFRGDGKDGA